MRRKHRIRFVHIFMISRMHLTIFTMRQKIMAEEDAAVQAGYIRLLELTKSALEICIDLLGFEAPEKM